MKFFQWLTKKNIDRGVCDNTESVLNTELKLMKIMEEIENSKKFIDPETKKEYKTKSALKAVITRRLNKLNKERKNGK